MTARTCRLLLIASLFALTASAREKEKPARPPQTVIVRAPRAGEPFDDAEVDAYFEHATRKLGAEGRLFPIKCEGESCVLSLPASRTEAAAWPATAQRAEAATLVVGELYREGKAKQDQFSVAAGAFVIAESGAIVTCLHVANAKGTRNLAALTRDGRVIAVRRALAADTVNDLVILQLDLPEGTTLPALSLATEPAPLAATIGVMSHPDEHFWMWTPGVVARQTVIHEPPGEQFYTTITADFAKGSSGCPVLDERGNVIGVVNNTESIYYEDDGRKKQADLQMVVKNITPSWVVRKLVTAPQPGK